MATGEQLQTELTQLVQLAQGASNGVYYALESLCICFPGRISGSQVLNFPVFPILSQSAIFSGLL